MRSARRPARGQSMVEFALFIPLLAVLLGGISAFGFLLYAHVQVSNATREAARAGSLYLGGHFHYTSCFEATCPAGYGDGTPGRDTCWPLRTWVANGLAEINRGSKGCPATPITYSATVHSFGLLSSAECSGSITSNCWTLLPLTYGDGSAITGEPEPRKPLKVRVTYLFNVPFLGSVFRTNPISINKTVIMRIQDN